MWGLTEQYINFNLGEGNDDTSGENDAKYCWILLPYYVQNKSERSKMEYLSNLLKVS